MGASASRNWLKTPFCYRNSTHCQHTGAIIGGSVSGTISNQGLLSDVKILPNTTVSGGKLSKTIENAGTIENVQLLSNTVINGGTVQGRIYGFPPAPATINARIAAETDLSHITIGFESKVDPTVKFGEGVNFITNSTIPAGINLTSAFALIREPITGSIAVDLSQDVLLNEDSLLTAINAIPALKEDNLAFSQVPETGILWLAQADKHTVLLPITVHQIASDESATPRMTTHLDGSVTFVTETGRKILAQPAPQNPADLQSGLTQLGLTQVEAATNGNLTIWVADSQFKIRPDLYTTQLAEPDLPLGLAETPSPFVTGLNIFVLRFKDNAGVSRQQFFYPAPVDQAQLQSTLLQDFSDADTVKIYNNGKVSMTMGDNIFSAILDYRVELGTTETTAQSLRVEDKNGDGKEEIQMTYANGDQQLLYQIPFPIAAEVIQNIDDLTTAGFNVSQKPNGELLLTQGETQFLVKVTDMTELDEKQPSKIELQPDGNAEFITETGLQIIAQPVMQDFAALEAAFRPYGVPAITVEDNGNLTLQIDETSSLNARPDLASIPTWHNMPLGLHNFPTSLPGILTVALVFTDETGNKRQQNLYPAAKYPQELQQFFADLPEAETVQFNNNGTVSVSTSELTFRGLFDYTVTDSEAPTENIQITSLPDANNDGIDDFAIIYRNGERQIIYQIP